MRPPRDYGRVRGRFPAVVVAVLACVAFCYLLIPGPSGSADFRPALPGYVFAFPRDHFSHEEYRTEWWYYTGHVRAKGGERYGYQVTFFRSGLAEARANPSRWAARNLYLAHFAVSDISRRGFRYFERVSRAGLGQAGASETELRVWIGDWEVRGDGGTQRLRAKDGEHAVDLTLVTQKPPVVHGENGVSQKGEGRGHASHYYSLTRLKTDGTITVRGKAFPVTGLSWMDHEFGSTQLNPDQVGWDWFSLQLDDGSELMLSIIRKSDGRPDPYSAGTFVAPDGHTVGLRHPDFAVLPLEQWKSPRGRGVYPMKWRVSVPQVGVEVTVTPALADQELDTGKSTRVTYWEGAVFAEGTRQSRRVSGHGYVEMTGYSEPFRKKL